MMPKLASGNCTPFLDIAHNDRWFVTIKWFVYFFAFCYERGRVWAVRHLFKHEKLLKSRQDFFLLKVNRFDSTWIAMGLPCHRKTSASLSILFSLYIFSIWIEVNFHFKHIFLHSFFKSLSMSFCAQFCLRFLLANRKVLFKTLLYYIHFDMIIDVMKL